MTTTTRDDVYVSPPYEGLPEPVAIIAQAIYDAAMDAQRAGGRPVSFIDAPGRAHAALAALRLVEGGGQTHE